MYNLNPMMSMMPMMYATRLMQGETDNVPNVHQYYKNRYGCERDFYQDRFVRSHTLAVRPNNQVKDLNFWQKFCKAILFN